MNVGGQGEQIQLNVPPIQQGDKENTQVDIGETTVTKNANGTYSLTTKITVKDSEFVSERKFVLTRTNVKVPDGIKGNPDQYLKNYAAEQIKGDVTTKKAIAVACVKIINSDCKAVVQADSTGIRVLKGGKTKEIQLEQHLEKTESKLAVLKQIKSASNGLANNLKSPSAIVLKICGGNSNNDNATSFEKQHLQTIFSHNFKNKEYPFKESYKFELKDLDAEIVKYEKKLKVAKKAQQIVGLVASAGSRPQQLRRNPNNPHQPTRKPLPQPPLPKRPRTNLPANVSTNQRGSQLVNRESVEAKYQQINDSSSAKPEIGDEYPLTRDQIKKDLDTIFEGVSQNDALKSDSQKDQKVLEKKALILDCILHLQKSSKPEDKEALKTLLNAIHVAGPSEKGRISDNGCKVHARNIGLAMSAYLLSGLENNLSADLRARITK